MEKLVIFADYGLDDAAATISIFNANEKFESIVLIPIGGNVSAEMSYRNCYTLLSNYPQLLNKITVVNTCHIKQNNEYLADIHGKDGMGDFFVHPSEKIKATEISFEKWLSNYTGEEVILSLGPMSLVKDAVMKAVPKQLIIMGGCVKEEPNFKGYEFNQCLDKEAFNYCVKFPHVAITLDTCRIEKLDMRRYEITGNDIHSQIIRADQRLSVTRGEDGCYVWDDVAANYLLFPNRFITEVLDDNYGNTLTQAKYISDKLYFEN